MAQLLVLSLLFFGIISTSVSEAATSSTPKVKTVHKSAAKIKSRPLVSAKPLKKMRITSNFGMRTDPITGDKAFHDGIDLAAALNEKVHSMFDGIVTKITHSGGLGKSVEVYHPRAKIKTVSGHLNKIAVKPGQKIKAGQVLGFAGTTGRSTGVHLHLIAKNAHTGQLLNPAKVLHKHASYTAVAQAKAVKTAKPVKAAKPVLVAAQSADVKTVADADTNLEAQQANLRQAEAEVKLYDLLYREGVVSRKELEEKQSVLAGMQAVQQTGS